jgi:hypothetical protein
MLTPAIVNRCFQDLDELTTTLNSRRSVQITCLNEHPFQCHLLLLNIGAAEFLFIESDSALRVKSPKAENYIDFAFILKAAEREMVSHDFRVTQDTVFGFDNTRENNLVLPAKLRLGVLQIRRDVFNECLEIMGRSDISDRFLATNYLQSPTTCTTVRSYLHELYGLVKQNAPFLQLPQVQRFILEDLLPLLIEALPPIGDGASTLNSPLTRAQLVQQKHICWRA